MGINQFYRLSRTIGHVNREVRFTKHAKIQQALKKKKIKFELQSSKAQNHDKIKMTSRTSYFKKNHYNFVMIS